MKTTIETFIEKMEEDVKNGVVLPPAVWLERAMKLNTLKGSEIDKPLILLEGQVAREKSRLLVQPDMTSAKANAIVEGMAEYQSMRTLKAQQKQVEEFIRIAKLIAKTEQTNYYNS